MDTNLIIDISRDALAVSLKISLPILLVALGVGLIVSLIQALTQIQDQTITFVPKMVAIFFTVFLLLPYFGTVFSTFNETIVNQIITLK